MMLSGYSQGLVRGVENLESVLSVYWRSQICTLRSMGGQKASFCQYVPEMPPWQIPLGHCCGHNVEI